MDQVSKSDVYLAHLYNTSSLFVFIALPLNLLSTNVPAIVDQHWQFNTTAEIQARKQRFSLICNDVAQVVQKGFDENLSSLH